MNSFSEIFDGVKTVGIAGHIHPDGDCVGSCLGLYLYLKKYMPQLQADIYLEEPNPAFSYLEGFGDIRKTAGEIVYDLFIVVDVSSADRIGVAQACFRLAKKTLCIDHHISNRGFADVNWIRGDVSSASEVLYGLLEPEKVTKEIAEALYTGIVHDTGVFQYAATSPETMRIAGALMETGIPFGKIIEETFYEKTYVQNQVLGRVLTESIMMMDGKCIVGYLHLKDLQFYGIDPRDLDGIVSQLRLTKGIEAALFVYETQPQTFKVSMRSRGRVDVSRIAVYFGGGGHILAAGCTLEGTVHDVINNVMEQMALQLEEE